jgi:N-acetylmuramoyl-L-alanine amidase
MQMPAVLMEIAFMINPDELSKLLNPQFQELAAKSIAGSTRKYLFEKIRLERGNEAKEIK